MTPRLSILMPTYNVGRFLSEAIESVLAQTFNDFEIIIIDNCSTDNTMAIIEEYTARDRRVRYLVNDRNVGMVNNWNRCLMEAEGEFIKFVFADDKLCSSDTLERMVNALESDSDIVLVASARVIIDENSQEVGVTSYFRDGSLGDGKQVINCCLKYNRNLIGEPTAVMFRSCDATRGFALEYRQLVDLEMWFYLLEKGKFAYIAEPMVAFRIHPHQQTQQNRDCREVLPDNMLLTDSYLGKQYVSLSKICRMYLKYNNVYQFWKSCRKGIVSASYAEENIRKHMTLLRFWFGYPLFKIYKQIFDYQLKRLSKRSLVITSLK